MVKNLLDTQGYINFLPASFEDFTLHGLWFVACAHGAASVLAGIDLVSYKVESGILGKKGKYTEFQE